MSRTRRERTTLSHEFFSNSKTSMGAHNTQTGNVTVLNAIGRIFFHFRKDIADDAGVVVGGFLGTRDVDCDEGELWPGEGMVEVIFHEIARGG